jgi:hypothetical protein
MADSGGGRRGALEARAFAGDTNNTVIAGNARQHFNLEIFVAD